MATPNKQQGSGDGPLSHPVGATAKSRSRFSLISLFTNSQNSQSFRSKKSKNAKKDRSKSKSTISTTSISSTTTAADSITTTTATAADVSAVVVTSKTRIDSSSGLELRECPLCYDELPAGSFPDLMVKCGHRSCCSCLLEYLKIEIKESRIDISCPECKERLHPADIQQLLSNHSDYMDKYEEFMVRKVLVTDPDTRWCPAPDCGYAVIASGCADCPVLQCKRPGCNTLFCYHCKQKWHPNQTCDAARRERFPTTLRLSLSDIQSLARTAEEYKSCPRCKTMINKMDDGSCNHMTCSICGAQFCWLCLQEASDLHYLSPSGCTFWGKKPWTKKKKILWQLGTLVGAPVGIALLAGLSVPVLILGLPIWAARKLHQRFRLSNKHKRNAIVTFGTMLSFLASPIVAGIAIAIGVPVMLIYVYGVVPYSLCRGGTCGVKNEGGDVPYDLNDNANHAGGNGDDHSAVVQVVDNGSGRFVVANPSIGPSIGESSLTTGYSLSASGVQMDRVGLHDDQSDTKSASIQNMVGSICEGDAAAATASRKLEIKADMSITAASRYERKNSIDSQSLSQADNRSLRSFGPLDNRSHVSFNVDNASTKALAGSICAQRDKDNVSIAAANQDCTINSEVKSKSCIRGDHGSPVSNRSVSFATSHDETKAKSKSKKKLSSKRRHKRADLEVMETGSVNSKKSDAVPVGKRHLEVKARVGRCSTDMTAESSSPAGPLPAELTQVDIDAPPHQFSTLVIKQTVCNADSAASALSLTEGKILCNILEAEGNSV